MHTHADKPQENKTHLLAKAVCDKQIVDNFSPSFTNDRPEAFSFAKKSDKKNLGIDLNLLKIKPQYKKL